MTKVGLDVGTVRIGVAVSDPTETIAGGYETFFRTKNYEKDLTAIAAIAAEKKADAFVIGLPVNMDGTEGEKAEEIREFADDLSRFTDAKIVFQDERLSTVSAEKMLIESGMRREKRKQVIDKVAATIILQTYLDKMKNINN